MANWHHPQLHSTPRVTDAEGTNGQRTETSIPHRLSWASPLAAWLQCSPVSHGNIVMTTLIDHEISRLQRGTSRACRGPHLLPGHKRCYSRNISEARAPCSIP